MYNCKEYRNCNLLQTVFSTHCVLLECKGQQFFYTNIRYTYDLCVNLLMSLL